MFAHEFGAASPETLVINAERRKDHVFLHITRTERLVVIINDGDGVLWCHEETVKG